MTLEELKLIAHVMGVTFEQLKLIAHVMGVTFEQSFIFPDGEQIKTSNE